MILLTDGESNAKTKKSSGQGYDTKILHLAPAMESGYQVCSSSSTGCRNGCLFTAGRGRMNPVKEARIRRTLLWFKDRELFKAKILNELSAFSKRCKKRGTLPAVRLNGTSDIMWEKQFPALFKLFPKMQFYDYTKHYKRCLKSYRLPPNYHLTFSRSEDNDILCRRVLCSGRINVVVVFENKDFPDNFWGYPTYSSDNDDLRFLDPPGGHVGCLYAKGDAKKDTSGFVLPILST